MNDVFFPLRVTPGITGLYLKSLCGAEELAVDSTGTRTAIQLLKALMRNDSNRQAGIDVDAARIVTADRDRILAHLYISLYGSKVQSTLHCASCEKPFDLDFALTELMQHYQLAPALAMKDDGYELESGGRFRLPTGEDELMAAALSQADAGHFLLQRCLLQGSLENDSDIVQQKMAEIAPVLHINMQAPCPECGHVQEVQFDVQSFLLTRLLQERPQLLLEIHRIAAQYHWSQEAILNLPRNIRKHYVSLIEAER